MNIDNQEKHSDIDVRESIWRARLRQADVARLLEIKPQQLNYWCTGRHIPSKVWQRELERFFNRRGVEIAYLKTE